MAQDGIIVTSSVAMSLDGYIDDSSGEQLILSNPEDFALVDKLRAAQDAILVGAGTLRKDNPRLLIRSDSLREKREASSCSVDLVKATITFSGELNPDLKFFRTGEAEKIVYCPDNVAAGLRASLEGLANVVSFPGSQVDPLKVLVDLRERGVRKLLIEGGERIHSVFLQADLVDELRVAIAPFFVGEEGAPRFVLPGSFPHDMNNRMDLLSVEQVGDMSVLHYKCNKE